MEAVIFLPFSFMHHDGFRSSPLLDSGIAKNESMAMVEKEVSTMIEILTESRGNLLAIKGSGKLTGRDYEELLIPSLEAIMKEHHKARLLFYMDADFEGWELGAAWDYASFGFKHKDDFEKVAAVCGPKWVHWGMKLKSYFVNGDVRTFRCEESSEAWKWIEA